MAVGLFVGTAKVQASSFDNTVIVKGVVHTEKGADKNVTAITIKTINGESVRVVLNKTGNDVARIDGYGIFAMGSYDEHGDFVVTTWFMRREYEKDWAHQ
jgi:hypothetical protein